MVQPNKAVMNYFEKGVNKGISLEKLSDNLLAQGWPPGNIEVSLREFKNKSSSSFKIPKPVATNNFHDSIHAGRIPPFLNVTSILYYISGGLMILIPVLILALGASFFGGIGAAIGGFFGTVLIIILLPFIVMSFILAVKLRKGKKWAKVVALIFAILGIVVGISTLFSGGFAFSIPSFAVNLFVAWTLLGDKGTKEFFKVKNNF